MTVGELLLLVLLTRMVVVGRRPAEGNEWTRTAPLRMGNAKEAQVKRNARETAF
jgi:hypothetical protein